MISDKIEATRLEELARIHHSANHHQRQLAIDGYPPHETEILEDSFFRDLADIRERLTSGGWVNRSFQDAGKGLSFSGVLV